MESIKRFFYFVTLLVGQLLLSRAAFCKDLNVLVITANRESKLFTVGEPEDRVETAEISKQILALSSSGSDETLLIDRLPEIIVVGLQEGHPDQKMGIQYYDLLAEENMSGFTTAGFNNQKIFIFVRKDCAEIAKVTSIGTVNTTKSPGVCLFAKIKKLIGYLPGKGGIIANVEIGGKLFGFITAHLSPQSSGTREEQIAKILRAMGGLSAGVALPAGTDLKTINTELNKYAAIFLMGDLNTRIPRDALHTAIKLQSSTPETLRIQDLVSALTDPLKRKDIYNAANDEFNKLPLHYIFQFQNTSLPDLHWKDAPPPTYKLRRGRVDGKESKVCDLQDACSKLQESIQSPPAIEKGALIKQCYFPRQEADALLKTVDYDATSKLIDAGNLDFITVRPGPLTVLDAGLAPIAVSKTGTTITLVGQVLSLTGCSDHPLFLKKYDIHIPDPDPIL